MMICSICDHTTDSYFGLNAWYECSNPSCRALICDGCARGKPRGQHYIVSEQLYDVANKKICPRCGMPLRRK